jgi:hypothetical protein
VAPPQKKFWSTDCNILAQRVKALRRKHERSMEARAARPPCRACGKTIPMDRRADAVFCSQSCYRGEANARWLGRASGYMRAYLYGLTEQQYAAMLAAQGDRCAICRTDTPGGKGGWHTDHDHGTGKVRGLLCHNCNLMVGHAQDDPAILRAAVDYLMR